MARIKHSTFAAAALALAVGAVGFHAGAQQLGMQQAIGKLEAAGYTRISDVEYDDGVWEADVVRKDGSRGEVAVDPATGEIFDAVSDRPLLSANAVLGHLSKAGYVNVQELERKGALWEAEAWDKNGTPLELTISGHDGRVLHQKPDRF